MSDVFERLKCGSAAHKVKVNSDGSFTLEPLADKDSLKAFQPKAKEAIQAASEGQFTIIKTHTSGGVSGNLYDQIIISYDGSLRAECWPTRLAVAAYALAVITHSRVRPAVTRLSVPSHKLNRVAGEQKMSNFDRLKSGSAGHRASVNSDGSLTISATGFDKRSLEAFQPHAQMALNAARDGQIRIVKAHLSALFSGTSGQNLYDQIILDRV